MTISELSRILKVCRKTIRERLREGWSVSNIKDYYSKKRRVTNNKKNHLNVENKIQAIESMTGESLEVTLKKILTWTNNKEEIAFALGITEEEFEQCIRAKSPSLVLQIK